MSANKDTTNASSKKIKLVTSIRETQSSAIGSSTTPKQPSEAIVKWPELAEAHSKVQQRTFTDLETIYKLQSTLLNMDSRSLRADISERERIELLRLASIINSKLSNSVVLNSDDK